MGDSSPQHYISLQFVARVQQGHQQLKLIDPFKYVLRTNKIIWTWEKIGESQKTWPIFHFPFAIRLYGGLMKLEIHSEEILFKNNKQVHRCRLLLFFF